MKIFRKQTKKKPDRERPIHLPDIGDEPFFREVDIEFLVHELKDPIAVIETGLRTLLERKEKYGPLSPKQERTLNRTLRNSRKARSMLRNLLEIGRSQSGCFTTCRFRPCEAAVEVLKDALEIVAWRVFEEFCEYDNEPDMLACLSRNGIYLDIDPRVRDTEMVQDETKFCQIVGNLIKNALHYRRERLDIRMDRQGEFFSIEVADDGPGIDPEYHQLIFQRYARLKECAITPRDGHGLGLAGARILARCMGGDIQVSSEKGKGTAFRMVLPLAMSP